MEKGKSIPWKKTTHTHKHSQASLSINKNDFIMPVLSKCNGFFLMISISKFDGLYMQFSKYYVIKYEI